MTGYYTKEERRLYMREWRKANPPNLEQRRKSGARSIAHMGVKRGHIPRQPCAICDSLSSQLHHPDYARPRLVVWICRTHHEQLHKFEHDGRVPPLDQWDEPLRHVKPSDHGHHFVEGGHRRWCLGCGLYQQRVKGGDWPPPRYECERTSPWAREHYGKDQQ